jgi:hypothetical protein
MKNSILIVLLLVLSSFAINSDSKKEVLYKTEKGTLILDKDFLKINFSKDYYLRGEGSFVDMLVLNDKKNYLGSVEESDYKINKMNLIQKYQSELKKKFNFYNYSEKILRVEKRNRKCYFFYYEQLAQVSFGDRMPSGKICIGGHIGDYQVREKNIIVTLYLDGKFKYGEKIARDADYNIVERKDFLPLHLKTIVY